jgi:NAD(P)-dependent dehydrogenase (short-subunit alcohol dehydrogenase family)
VERSRVFTDDALEGRVAIVTGGGTNLGKGAAAELLRCGASVVIAGRRREILERAAGELGVGCSWTAGDVRERSGAEAIVSAALDRFGRVDLVLNNAGGQYMVPAEGLTAKGWRAVHRINLNGTLAMCEAAYELAMRDAGAGTIVNVTVSPHHGMPAMAHTGAARAAVEAMTRELASEYGKRGISIVAVALGRFDTESLRKYPAELWRTAAATVPLQRLGMLEEYGWLVALLATPLGAAMSGTVITLDGALDNWTGPWRPPGLSGTARFRPSRAERPREDTAPATICSHAGEVLTVAREPSKL